jgi:Flp pilus assembly protein TadG
MVSIHRRSRLRQGNAAVELAITLPLMMIIVLGSVEICQLIHTRQVIEAAAYQCALIAVDPDATNAAVQDRMNEILSQRGVRSGSVVTTPADIEGLPRGESITVVIAAPFADNTWVPARFTGLATIESSCVMLKEI